MVKCEACAVYTDPTRDFSPSSRPLPPLQSHRRVVDGVVAVARRVQADKELTALIRRKFAIKCTTGVELSLIHI